MLTKKTVWTPYVASYQKVKALKKELIQSIKK